MKKLLVVLSILLFASIAFANTVEIRLLGVNDGTGDDNPDNIYINAFLLKFYDVGSDACEAGTCQHPVDITDFSFSWADPPQVTRVVWTLDNYPYEVDGDYLVTGYAISGPGRAIGALKDGLVVTLTSQAKFGIDPSNLSNYIYGVGQGSTNLIGTTLQVEEQWVSANQIITISPAAASLCAWDTEPDGDVDGLDLHAGPADLQAFALEFGKADC